MIEEVWTPLKGTSQARAFFSPAHHTLFTGARGPGKTDTQLMRFARLCGVGYGPFWRGVIFDREYKNLDDLVQKSLRWFPRFSEKHRPKFLRSVSDYKWVWPTGEELLFRQAKRDSDYWSFHGHEYPFIGWNELTKYATSSLYDKLMSTNRSSFTPEAETPRKRLEDAAGNVIYDYDAGILLPDIPLEVFSTTNPYGPGHNWVKRRFISPAPFGTIVRITAKVYDPKLKEEREVTKTQVALHGSYKENPFLSAEYIMELSRNSNQAEKKAWLEGDWDIVAGGAIDDVWDRRVHVVPRFRVPDNWHVDRGLDWGSTEPYAVIWFCEANGEEVTMEDGSTWCPAKGSIIALAEDYGTNEIGTNKGLKKGAKTLAQDIIKREISLLESGWIEKQPARGPADNQIRNVTERDTDTIEKIMGKEGVRWTESDKAKGTRIIGLQLIRERLENALKGEGPGLYFMDNCRDSIETIPVLPRDEDNPDDVDTTAEDHLYDVVRYRVLAGGARIARTLKNLRIGISG